MTAPAGLAAPRPVAAAHPGGAPDYPSLTGTLQGGMAGIAATAGATLSVWTDLSDPTTLRAFSDALTEIRDRARRYLTHSELPVGRNEQESR